MGVNGMNLAVKEDAVLAVIDLQEKLMPAMANAQQLEHTALKLIKGLKILGVPAIVTQQYTKGLGATIPSVAQALGDYEPVEKTTFSAMKEPAFAEALKKSGKKTVILIGIEAHICVQQTALQLLEEGCRVYVIRDCIASRSETDSACSMQRMAAAGVVITTYESILYELLGGAGEEGFKAISSIVK